MDRKTNIQDFDYLERQYNKTFSKIDLITSNIIAKEGNVNFDTISSNLIRTFHYGELIGKPRKELRQLLHYSLELTMVSVSLQVDTSTKKKIKFNNHTFTLSGNSNHNNLGIETWLQATYLATILRTQKTLQNLLSLPSNAFDKSPISHDPWTKAEMLYLAKILSNSKTAQDAFAQLTTTINNLSTIRVLLDGGFEAIPATPERQDLIESVYYPTISMFQHAKNQTETNFSNHLQETIESLRIYISKSNQFSEPKYWVYFPLIAACAYAHDQGIAITVESDYLPKWLIEGR